MLKKLFLIYNHALFRTMDLNALLFRRLKGMQTMAELLSLPLLGVSKIELVIFLLLSVEFRNALFCGLGTDQVMCRPCVGKTLMME